MHELEGALEALGLGPWFRERLDPGLAGGFSLARVAAVDKDSCLVNTGTKEVQAQLTGKMLWAADSSLDYPCVGDWVYVQLLDDDSFAVVHQIMPRKTSLARKTSGKKVDFQLIAANVDVAFVVQALGRDFNPNRLERYLVMANQGGVRPVVLLSKSDLFSPEEVAAKTEEIRAHASDARIMAFSNLTGQGLDEVLGLMKAGTTYCLLGSSGVGKTTLLNNMLGEGGFATRDVRIKDERGRHTTSRRYLMRLPSGAVLIDTPGMREVGGLSVDEGLSETFREIQELAETCRYRDCTHTTEKGCAVLEALRDESLSVKRYENYMKMVRESSHNQMSYFEKRQKDKSFGKMVKDVMKSKGKRS
ncbi:MAG: ribosome small subunit-dependent GTPase A [Desulfarculaceae bacterium]|nr:ribosome small subunit-dependent GTPase A [Desulfarculaceae bacterium]